MGAVARAEQFEQRARKPQARGKLRVIASIFAVRGIRKQLAEVARTIDLAAARAEAIASLASSMDRSEEHSSPFICGDCAGELWRGSASSRVKESE